MFIVFFFPTVGCFGNVSFQPLVDLALCRFGLVFLGNLIEMVRYMIYNRVMVLDSCQNFLIFILLLDIKMLS